ncbi:dihydroorotate dehydrogenase electron transfer subunit [Halalkalibacillus halophilus]|uniref:dihydroorotate dehydrogenase electron transfer subunit n=1 Tax=Halalkalibacillus halophilus TaxID=392827 RepID=UPI0003F54C87
MISDLRVMSNDEIAFNTYEMKLYGPAVAQYTMPGQFLHLRIGEGYEHMLRRPISIADVDLIRNVVTIVYKQLGEGTAWLRSRKPEDLINVLGPQGNGFNVNQYSQEHLIVIGGGVGVPPLYYLTKQLAKNNKVTAILGFQDQSSVFYEEAFSKFSEVYIATNDGSYGEKGFVTDILESQQLTNHPYYACGPTPMLKAIQNKLDGVSGYLSFEERMGCGIGACFACVCESTNQQGYVKICQDGPVLKAREVIL